MEGRKINLKCRRVLIYKRQGIRPFQEIFSSRIYGDREIALQVAWAGQLFGNGVCDMDISGSAAGGYWISWFGINIHRIVERFLGTFQNFRICDPHDDLNLNISGGNFIIRVTSQIGYINEYFPGCGIIIAVSTLAEIPVASSSGISIQSSVLHADIHPVITEISDRDNLGLDRCISFVITPEIFWCPEIAHIDWFHSLRNYILQTEHSFFIACIVHYQTIVNISAGG